MAEITDKLTFGVTIKRCDECARVEVVVRCRDCRFFFDGECHHSRTRLAVRVPDFGEHYKFVSPVLVSEEHFCGYAERKEHGSDKR